MPISSSASFADSAGTTTIIREYEIPKAVLVRLGAK